MSNDGKTVKKTHYHFYEKGRLCREKEENTKNSTEKKEENSTHEMFLRRWCMKKCFIILFR